VDTLALKLVLTPTLIGAASLAGRRWGPAVSGWLVGLPFTSAPIALFLALGEGPSFAAGAAVGAMAGALSQAAFSLAYGGLAPRLGWAGALAGGSLAFALATAALRLVSLPLWPLAAIVVAGLALAVRAMPGGAPDGRPAASPPRWDLPARMILATGYVVALTAAAPALGPRLTGLLSPFPLYAAILAGFAHHLHGPVAAVTVLRGLLLGLFAFAGFFLAIAALIERTGIAAAFGAAVALALSLQAGALWRLRRVERRGSGGRGRPATSRR
jgi:hypothetical protein